jgi:hypothetical protein
MERTLEWVLKHRPDRVDLNILIPFPGTPIVDGKGTYDLYWTKQLPEVWFYKGHEQEINALVGTSALTPSEIKDFHSFAIEQIRQAGIPY